MMGKFCYFVLLVGQIWGLKGGDFIQGWGIIFGRGKGGEGGEAGEWNRVEWCGVVSWEGKGKGKGNFGL
jgi:hypothetical protein